MLGRGILTVIAGRSSPGRIPFRLANRVSGILRTRIKAWPRGRRLRLIEQRLLLWRRWWRRGRGWVGRARLRLLLGLGRRLRWLRRSLRRNRYWWAGPLHGLKLL